MSLGVDDFGSPERSNGLLDNSGGGDFELPAEAGEAEDGAEFWGDYDILGLWAHQQAGAARAQDAPTSLPALPGPQPEPPSGGGGGGGGEGEVIRREG